MKKILAFLIVGLLLSCNPNLRMIEDHLVYLRKFVFIPEIASWEILEYIGKQNNRIAIQTTYSDTTYLLKYLTYEDIPKQLDTFWKTFRSNGFYYRIVLNYNDTIYFYRSHDSSFKDKEFIIGKYKYQVNHMELSESQLNYYHQNMDSLLGLRGDTLPELPGIE